MSLLSINTGSCRMLLPRVKQDVNPFLILFDHARTKTESADILFNLKNRHSRPWPKVLPESSEILIGINTGFTTGLSVLTASQWNTHHNVELPKRSL